ncbi:MAG: helix-turn-helix domain-containing protein [Bacteroides sp.]|nr:helix-turn-helix domain-containing protein [Bacteroides sp.]
MKRIFFIIFTLIFASTKHKILKTMPNITPQFTLEALYVSPFTARRSFDDNGTTVYNPIERRTAPSGIDLLDSYVRHLTTGGRREYFCRSAGLTTGELSVFLQLLTGLTAVEFSRRYVLRLGTDLLRFTEMDVCDVAHRCGFSDAAIFYRLVRSAYKITPQEYHRRFRKKGDAGRYAI